MLTSLMKCCLQNLQCDMAGRLLQKQNRKRGRWHESNGILAVDSAIIRCSVSHIDAHSQRYQEFLRQKMYSSSIDQASKITSETGAMVKPSQIYTYRP